MNMKTIIKAVTGFILLGIVLFGAIYADNIKRLYVAVTLYDEAKIADNFVNMGGAFNVSTLNPSSTPLPLQDRPQTIPDTLMITSSEREETLSTFLQTSRTTSLLVLHKGQIVKEYYGETGAADRPHISFSVAKSFVSALFGIAVDKGFVKSIEETVTDYVPELSDSGYNGVRIKDVLQMSSGVLFNEDYADFNSDINRFSRAIAFGTSLDDFTASLTREREPGKYNHYVSIDTQVLGMILVRATQKSLTELAQMWLWEPLAMQDTAYWLSDDNGMELALGGLNITARDYAKFGLMFANDGQLNGQQIVPLDWLKASVTPDAPHLFAGNNDASSSDYGYGFQWWIPPNADDEFMAKGIYHQYIYIDPDAEVVVVKTSANHKYNDKQEDWPERHLAMFREIVEYYKTVK